MNYAYSIRRSRRRSVALVIAPDATLTVRAPLRTPLHQIERFVSEKRAWIEKTIEKIRARPAPRKPRYVEGETYSYLGKLFALRICDTQSAALTFDSGFFLHSASAYRAPKLFEQWYRVQAYTVISERVAVLAQQMQVAVNKIRISSARRRWGSCSSAGTLSFTWRLIMAPIEVVDYVVIHELAHRLELNHSPAFWRIVAAQCPQFRAREAWLKEHGHAYTGE